MNETKRPEHFDNTMDFIYSPEREELLAYIEKLESSRYIAFVYAGYDPNGGMNDKEWSGKNIEDGKQAIKEIVKKSEFDLDRIDDYCLYVYDTIDKKTVWWFDMLSTEEKQEFLK